MTSEPVDLDPPAPRVRAPRRAGDGRGRPPSRTSRVWFLGAGASKSAGLPLTEELLERIHPRIDGPLWKRVRQAKGAWGRDLYKVYRVIYPDGGVSGFRPGVADLFTQLEVASRSYEQRARVPLRATELLKDLRQEIALGLTYDAERVDIETTTHFERLTSSDRPQVVITSNWDDLVERVAKHLKLKVWFQWPLDPRTGGRRKLGKDELLVLKLHGSIDWTTGASIKLCPSPHGNFITPLSVERGVVHEFARGRKSAFDAFYLRQRFPGVEPLMATMAVGKDVQVDLLEPVWSDAYYSISRARQLEVFGYSFPSDDLEIKMLLRLGTRKARGSDIADNLEIVIRNPSPEAHVRARTHLGNKLISHYR